MVPPTTGHNGTHAIVIGGSIAGLLAARVLSDHFDRVTVVERDKLADAPEARKGQPQVRHLHALMTRGFQIMQRYFPDLAEGLRSENTLQDNARSMRWYCYGGYRARFDFGMQVVFASRPFLEWHIRQRVLALPNLEVFDGCVVEGLLTSSDQSEVTGVRIVRRSNGEQPQTLRASLVVDATGRGSHAPRWLQTLGYPQPDHSSVTCGTGYATRVYRRNPSEPGGNDWRFITPEAPREKRMGGAFPIEGDRWLVSLGGWHGDHAPTDEQGFQSFARSLPAPDVYEIVSRCEPLSEITTHKFPASLRRHYEKLKRFPAGLLVLGDAICSFNPLYGQGMTTAALQVAELDALLSERGGNLDGIAGLFFARAAKVIDGPWQTAVGEDFRFPETQGKKAPGTNAINAYVAHVHRATHHDPVVGMAFLRVMNLIEPPTSLLHPRIVWRVFKDRMLRRRRMRQSTTHPTIEGSMQ